MSTRDELLAKAQLPSAQALELHPYYRGKIQTIAKCPVRGMDDFAIWYSPGVAAPCKAIAARPELVYEYTNKGNSIAIVTDGTRVLGLGDIGPEAGLPVMEGKALLFKYLGGVDAVPICLGTRDERELVRTVKLLEPSFGAINLEDIAQPKCFRILAALRAELGIPVWHDDQQGTATVTLAALLNALEVVDKPLSRVRIVLVGLGAANFAVYRVLVAAGVDPHAIVACDSHGTLHRGRADVDAAREALAEKWRVCCESNGDSIAGGIGEALRGADVCIAFSSAGAVRPEWVKTMARDAIVFACANPVPEVWPWEAKEAGARVVATCSTCARAPSPTAWRWRRRGSWRAARRSRDCRPSASCLPWTTSRSPSARPSPRGSRPRRRASHDWPSRRTSCGRWPRRPSVPREKPPTR
jgi:malate dehydrogenase (oxaloacetate-decarboxylating)